MALGTATLTAAVPNPFRGNPTAGSLATPATLPRWQLLEPFPQYGSNAVSMTSSGAHSDYNALILQFHKRAGSSGWWGGNFNYTYSRLNDNQIGQANYYSSAPGILDNYNFIPGSKNFNPDVDYGLSLPWIYVFWVGVVVALYFPCRWYAGVKQRRRDLWWLSYF
jgi:hypothetical protein